MGDIFRARVPRTKFLITGLLKCFFFPLKNDPFLLEHSKVEDFVIGIVISASESEFRD